MLYRIRILFKCGVVSDHCKRFGIMTGHLGVCEQISGPQTRDWNRHAKEQLLCGKMDRHR